MQAQTEIDSGSDQFSTEPYMVTHPASVLMFLVDALEANRADLPQEIVALLPTAHACLERWYRDAHRKLEMVAEAAEESVPDLDAGWEHQ
jgi:hypothetical protein